MVDSTSCLVSAVILASFLLRLLLRKRYSRVVASAAANTNNPRTNMFDAVGPWSSRRWNPELDVIVVGLLMQTLGLASASLVVEAPCPILSLVEV